MRACRKYVLVTVSSKVRASLSSSTMRGLTGCTNHSPGRSINDRAMLAHQLAQRRNAAAAGPAGGGVAGDVGHAAGPVGDGLHDVAVGHDVAVADEHGRR